MYTDNLKNLIGTQCVCCNQFIPIQGTDEYGHTTKFPENKIGLCPECFNTLIGMIKEQKDNKPKLPY